MGKKGIPPDRGLLSFCCLAEQMVLADWW